MAMIIKKMREAKDFTDNDSILARYILSNAELVLSMSIYQLSSNTHISVAGIVRFCKKCGASGFRNFKILLARDYEQTLLTVEDIDANMPFSKGDDPLTISSKIAKLTTETTLSTQNLLTTRKLQKVISLFKSAKNIYGIGVSGNYIRLSDFQLKLLQINYHLQLIPLQAEQFYLSINSTEDDIAIIISRSGSTAEVVNDAKHFRQNSTPIIAITDSEHNPLATYANVVLLIPPKETSPFGVSNFSSQISVEYILNTIYSCLFNNNFDENFSNLRKTPKSHFSL